MKESSNYWTTTLQAMANLLCVYLTGVHILKV